MFNNLTYNLPDKSFIFVLPVFFLNYWDDLSDLMSKKSVERSSQIRYMYMTCVIHDLKI